MNETLAPAISGRFKGSNRKNRAREAVPTALCQLCDEGNRRLSLSLTVIGILLVRLYLCLCICILFIYIHSFTNLFISSSSHCQLRVSFHAKEICLSQLVDQFWNTLLYSKKKKILKHTLHNSGKFSPFICDRSKWKGNQIKEETMWNPKIFVSKTLTIIEMTIIIIEIANGNDNCYDHHYRNYSSQNYNKYESNKNKRLWFSGQICFWMKWYRK